MQFEFRFGFFADNYGKCIADQVVSLTSDHARVEIVPDQTIKEDRCRFGLG